jgi:hypothetical protein
VSSVLSKPARARRHRERVRCAAKPALLALPALFAALVLAVGAPAACGTGIDLGGSSEGGAQEAGATCPAFVSPEDDASCGACYKGDEDCQPNGCYNRYLCDEAERDCKSPDASCTERDAR